MQHWPALSCHPYKMLGQVLLCADVDQNISLPPSNQLYFILSNVVS